jgi:glycogen debranching enzyme
VYSWSPFRNNGSLWSNHPTQGNQYDRNKYYEYKMSSTPGNSLTTDGHIDIEIRQSGSFSFYLTYGEEKQPPTADAANTVDVAQSEQGIKDMCLESRPRPRRRSSVTDLELAQRQSKTFHFIVATSFKLNGRHLAQNELTIQTVLSKLMGRVDTWEPKIKAIADKGYNMIHFVPLRLAVFDLRSIGVGSCRLSKRRARH